MKKTLATSAALIILAFGAIAFAHGPGYGGGYGGGHMGPGYGGGYGGGHMGPGYMMRTADTEEGKKFLTETKEIRKKIHDLMFELKEAWIAGDDTKAKEIDKAIDELREQIYKKAEASGITGDKRSGYGYGGHMGYGYGGHGYGKHCFDN